MSRVNIWDIIDEMTPTNNNSISKAVEPTTADEIEEELETSTAEDVQINTNNEEDKGE